jgi:hypothetical protein
MSLSDRIRDTSTSDWVPSLSFLLLYYARALKTILLNHNRNAMVLVYQFCVPLADYWNAGGGWGGGGGGG